MFRSLIFLMIFLWQESTQAAALPVLKVTAYELDPYVTEAGEEHGFLYDVVQEAFTKAGYKLDIQFYPRLRARSLVESGERDVLLPTYSSSTVSKSLLYSQPLQGSPIGYLKLKGSGSDSRHIIASALDDAALDKRTLQSLGPNTISSFPVENTAQLLDMLNQKRIDVAVADQFVAAQAIVAKRPHLLGKIQFVDPPLLQKEFHVAFSLKNPKAQKIAMDFNKALLEMQNSGRYEEILRFYGFWRGHNDPKTLNTVTVKNEDMKIMEKLSGNFLKTHPGVKFKWISLDENILRRRTLTSIALDDGVFDVITVGANDVAIHMAENWLRPLDHLPNSYDVDDLFPIAKRTLSKDGKYYALPFYGETSITFYRKDLFEKAKIQMPKDPTYPKIAELAKKVHNPAEGVYGLCLRGKAGWGENAALLSTMIHTFGGVWFDKNWQPMMASKEWKEAINYYVYLTRNFGPPNTASHGYLENLKLFADGKCAMWIDATVAASYLSDPKNSKVAGKVDYAMAPKMRFDSGKQWNWNWALAVTSSSKKRALAEAFVRWATSKEYIALVAKERGWAQVPPGTRRSTYNEAYLKAAPFAQFTLEAMNAYQPLSLVHKDLPYRGEVFVEIPVFPAVGAAVGNHVSDILKGRESLEEALQNSQRDVRNIMYHAGYYRNESPPPLSGSSSDK